MNNENRPTGPNVKRLWIHLFSLDCTSLAGGIEMIKALGTDEGREKMRGKRDEAFAMIDLVKAAPDNPYKTDEEIAGAIMDGVEKRKAGGA